MDLIPDYSKLPELEWVKHTTMWPVPFLSSQLYNILYCLDHKLTWIVVWYCTWLHTRAFTIFLLQINTFIVNTISLETFNGSTSTSNRLQRTLTFHGGCLSLSMGVIMKWRRLPTDFTIESFLLIWYHFKELFPLPICHNCPIISFEVWLKWRIGGAIRRFGVSFTWQSFCPWLLCGRLSREEEVEEARCNYERYRALVLNAFKNVADSDALAKIDVDEMYPTTTTSRDKKSKLKWARCLVCQHIACPCLGL